MPLTPPAFMIIRTYALYGQSKRILALLLAIVLAAWGVGAVSESCEGQRWLEFG